MTNLLKNIIIVAALISLCLISNPGLAAAKDLLVSAPGIDCSAGTSASKSAVCAEHGSTDSPLTGCPSKCGTGILANITNIVAYVAGAAAIIIIVVGAIRYITSGSDTSVGSRIDDDVLNAKRSIVSALIGLAIIVLARTLIIYVIKKL